MPQKRSFIWKIPKEEFEKNVKDAISYNQLVKKLYNRSVNHRTVKNRIEEEKIDTTHFKNECDSTSISLEEILIKNSSFNNGQRIKKKLIKSNILEDKCSECGLGNIWNNKSIALQLDHINGDHTDNRIENLRILCPNCHSQTSTFCKNKKRNVLVKEDNEDKKIIEPINQIKICPDCNGKKTARAIRCKNCRYVKSRKVKDRPSIETLQKEVEETSYVSVANKYGVADNTIRGWLRIK